jgi:hypothetical protein
MVTKKKTAKKAISKPRLKNKAPGDLDLKGRGGSVKGGISYIAYIENDSFSNPGNGAAGVVGKRHPGPGGTGG